MFPTNLSPYLSRFYATFSEDLAPSASYPSKPNCFCFALHLWSELWSNDSEAKAANRSCTTERIIPEVRWRRCFVFCFFLFVIHSTACIVLWKSFLRYEHSGDMCILVIHANYIPVVSFSLPHVLVYLFVAWKPRPFLCAPRTFELIPHSCRSSFSSVKGVHRWR